MRRSRFRRRGVAGRRRALRIGRRKKFKLTRGAVQRGGTRL